MSSQTYLYSIIISGDFNQTFDMTITQNVNTKATVEWKKMDEVDSYILSINGSTEVIDRDKTSFDLTNLHPGRFYHLKVTGLLLLHMQENLTHELVFTAGMFNMILPNFIFVLKYPCLVTNYICIHY